MVNLIYTDFRSCRDLTFRNQITGAGISILNYISEGFCRNSDAEFRQFLNISSGSTGEVKSMYCIAEDQKYTNKETAFERRTRCQRIINGNSRLMKYLKSSKTHQTTRPVDQKTSGPVDQQTSRPADQQTIY